MLWQPGHVTCGEDDAARGVHKGGGGITPKEMNVHGPLSASRSLNVLDFKGWWLALGACWLVEVASGSRLEVDGGWRLVAADGSGRLAVGPWGLS